MKKPVMILLYALCALGLLALPFNIPSGAMLESRAQEYRDAVDGGDAFDFLGLFARAARAEADEAYALPVDFSAGMTPNPAAYTQDGYEDESLRVRMETREAEGVVYRLAWVTVRHPSQLRTATAGKKNSTKVAMPSAMARANNAVVAINGDYYNDRTSGLIVRQGEIFRKGRVKTLDLLVIDDLGNFNIFLQSNAEELQAFTETGRQIVNAFTFGPALVKDNELLETPTDYSFNPNGREPRSAIGQVGELSYVLVVAEGRTQDSDGVTFQELANFMSDIGCYQAYNLDGGNSATMIFNNDYYNTKSARNERAQSDIIYFASAVDPAAWQ